MRRLRRTLLVLAGLGIVVCVLAAHYYYKGYYKWRHVSGAAAPDAVRLRRVEAQRLSEKADELRRFLGSSGGRYSSRVAFLVDMRLPSGRNRFFVYDLGGDSIRMAGLVAHGSGSHTFSLTPAFSNVNGSHCSALGRYRVGGPYAGQFGRAYTLHGLDTTNDNALERHIVLHSYSCVPEGETDPYPICNSQGCPMVAPVFLQRLQPLIDRSSRPILLWIFD